MRGSSSVVAKTPDCKCPVFEYWLSEDSSVHHLVGKQREYADLLLLLIIGNRTTTLIIGILHPNLTAILDELSEETERWKRVS